MANQSPKDPNAWNRFILWAQENQKVIWVLLLVIMAPTFAMTGIYTNALSRGEDGIVEARVFGRNVTRGERRRLLEVLSAARGLLLQGEYFVAFSQDQIFPLAPYTSGPLGIGGGASFSRAMDPVDFLALREEAKNLGLRVSSAELGDAIRELWQRQEALRRAHSEHTSSPQPPGSNPQMLDFQIKSSAAEKLKELRGNGGKYFDKASWIASIEGGAGRRGSVTVEEVESMLSDLILVAKLEAHVTSGVQPTPQEVFNSYQKERQTRTASFVELKIPAAALDAVSKALTADEVKAHYESQRASFERKEALRASWLLVPRDHFKAAAEKALTEEDIAKYYASHKNEYRKPTVLGGESEFALRSAEEKAAFEAKLYKPLAEVRDAVREKVLGEKTDAELRIFTEQLRARIYPPRTGEAAKTPPDRPAVAFSELVKEHPFLQTGTTAFAEQDKVKEAFGPAYSRTVDRWFTTLDQGKVPAMPPSYDDAEGSRVFYSRPESRPAGYAPNLAEIEGEVRSSLARQRILTEAETALRKRVSDNNAVKEGKKDLASLASGLEVKVGAETIRFDVGPVETPAAAVSRRGPLRVASKDAEKTEAEKKPADEDEEDPEASAGKVHAASADLVEALYALGDSERGNASVAKSLKEGALYVVQLDEVRLPDPGKFEEAKTGIERQLRAAEAATRFSSWQKALLDRALPPAK